MVYNNNGMKRKKREQYRRTSKRAAFFSVILALGLAGLLTTSSCSGGSSVLVVKADMLRLMDIFPRLNFDQAQEQPVNSLPAAEGEGSDSDVTDIFKTSINRDDMPGSPIHPLKLKFTKTPANGSSIGRQTKNIILSPPPSGFRLSVKLMRDYELRFGFAVLGEGWDTVGEEVTFSILAENLKDGGTEILYTKTIKPKKRLPHRRWLSDRTDLASIKGRAVNLVFKTSSSDPAAAGRAAAWMNPVLAAKDARRRRPNIILISADTLRADHLGCYGYERDTTPALDRLAAGAVRFQRVISQAPYTAPSHMSMLTSLYPSFHKVNRIKEDRLDPAVVTLAEALYGAGYRTWGITGGGQVSSGYGFAEGFESYMEFTSPKDDVKKKVAETIQFIQRNKNLPVFVFFHTYKPHAPYRPLPPYDTMYDPGYTGSLNGDIPTIEAVNSGKIAADQADLDHLTALYDGDIREMDDQLAELFRFLEDHDLWQDTILVFTSDHGEEFGEHGKYGVHSHTLYHELVSVPLILHYPGAEGKPSSVSEQVSSIDIYPTLLQLAGIKTPEGIQGSSFLPLMKKGRESGERPPAYSERLPSDAPFIRSLRRPDFTYMFWDYKDAGRNDHMYFDLRRDPWEQNSLDIPDGRLRSLFNQILFLIEEGKKPGKVWGKQELDPETLEILRTLGYIK